MEAKSFPEYLELSPRQLELSKLFRGRDELVKVAPEGWTYLEAIKNRIDDYLNFELEDSDVFVSSFPKSGTTWTQEIVWTMRNNPDLDNPDGTLPLSVRTPPLGDDAVVDHVFEKHPEYLEKIVRSFSDYDHSCGPFMNALKKSGRPRTIKTHLPFCLMPPALLEKRKVVYLIRDPRDVCISFHHHARLFVFDDFQGSLDQYIDAFLEDAVLFGPYWPHVHQAWKLRHHPNLLIVFYEKLRKNTMEEISKINDFLGTKLTDQQMEKVVHYTSFEAMKQRDDHVVAPPDAADFLNLDFAKKEGGFFREGQAGGWRRVLTQTQQDKFEAWIENTCPDKEIMENILST